jgi:hypothetical protein
MELNKPTKSLEHRHPIEALCVKALKSQSAALACLHVGELQAAKNIARTVFEDLVTLIYILSDNTALKLQKYIEHSVLRLDEYELKKLKRRAFNNKYGHPRNSINWHGEGNLSSLTEKSAPELMPLYLAVYDQYSHLAHSTYSSAKTHYFPSQKIEEALKPAGPDHHETGIVVFHVSKLAYLSVSHYCDYLGVHDQAVNEAMKVVLDNLDLIDPDPSNRYRFAEVEIDLDKILE